MVTVAASRPKTSPICSGAFELSLNPALPARLVGCIRLPLRPPVCMPCTIRYWELQYQLDRVSCRGMATVGSRPRTFQTCSGVLPRSQPPCRLVNPFSDQGLPLTRRARSSTTQSGTTAVCKGSQQGGTITGNISAATLNSFRPLFSVHLDN